MEQCQLVTDILQFPQGVGGDDRRGSPFQHVLADQLFHKVPHYRIQSVKGFVEEQIIRTAGQCQNGCRLPPHALGELSQRLVPRQLQMAAEFFETISVKIRIQIPVHAFHAVQICPCQKIEFVRHIGNAAFHSRIIPDRFAVDADFAAVRLIHTGERPQERGFSGTIRADHTVNTAGANGTGDIFQCGEILKPFCEILDLDHA